MKNKNRDGPQPSMANGTATDSPEPPACLVKNMEKRQYHHVILDIVASLHLNPDYSDLKIICQGRVFPVHQLVLCPRSEYFRRACCGSFEESQGSIVLEDRSPTLVEKMLEFLYTGNYTVRDDRIEVEIPQGDSANVSEPDHSEEPLQVEKNIVGRNAASFSNENNTSLVDEYQMSKRTPVTGDALFTGARGRMEETDDTLTDCHPCYFHLRMYGEADYFMIEDLKIRAEENFRCSFENCSEREILAQTINELYSTRANYRDIRKCATELIVKDLRKFKAGLTPVIDSDLLEANPEFATELCIATMDQYLRELSSNKHVVFSRYEYKPFR